jgi:predicted nucleic acid-binding protein
MVSADVGIWLAFLGNEPSAGALRALLDEARVTVHPLILIDLRLRLRAPQRAQILSDLQHLVATEIEPADVVSAFIEERGLAKLQVDVVGAHLLASAVRYGDRLWASDRELRAAAVELQVAFSPNGR